jgi:hypothetical protein
VGRPAVARAARLPGPPAPGRPGPGAGHLARPLYEFTGQLASFSPPTAEQQALFAAVAADQAETDRFFGVMTGAVPLADYFSPRNLLRLLGPRAMARLLVGRLRRPRPAAAPQAAAVES